MPAPSAMPGSGILTLTLDWELEIGGSPNWRRIDDLTPDVVDLLDSLRLPATWGVADPARSAATESVLASTQTHELAVLGDRSWLGWGAGGQRASRELTRRILGAAARNIPIRSLLLHHEASIPAGLPLVELGIRSIRQPIGHQVNRPDTLGSLPAGLQLAERVQKLALPQWWNWWDAQLRLVDLFHAHAHQAGIATVTHLGINAQQLCSAGTRGLIQLERLLAELVRLRDQANWRVATLAQWATAQASVERYAA